MLIFTNSVFEYFSSFLSAFAQILSQIFPKKQK